MAITPLNFPQYQAPDIGVGIERGLRLQSLAMQPEILQQQLATAQTAQRTAEADLPRVQAAAAAAQRNEAEQRALIDLVPQHLDENGNLNQKTFATAAAAAKISPQLRQAVFAADLKNTADQITNAEGEFKYQNKLEGVLAIKAKDALERGADPENVAAQWNQARATSQNAFGRAPTYIGMATPQNIQAMADQAYKATMTPKENDENARAKAEQQQRFDVEAYDTKNGPNGDPKTPQAKLAQDEYLRANPNADEAQVRKLGVFGIRNLPNGTNSIAQARANLSLGASQRAEFASRAVEFGNKADLAEGDLAAARKIPGGITGRFDAWVKKIADTETRRRLEAAAARHGFKPDSDITGLQGLLEAEVKAARGAQQSWDSLSKQGVIPQSGSPGGATSTPAPTPRSTAGGTTKMTKTVGGKTYTESIPTADVDEARAAGWKPAGGR
jgi:hypothetical protein